MNAKTILATSLLAAAVSLALGSTQAATIVIQNNDAANVGFNDPGVPNPAAGCQPSETLGACRLRVFNVAAQQWGALLDSAVTITVRAQMPSLTCSGNSAVLGSAGPRASYTNFANAPLPGTAYVQALANSLAGSNLAGGNYDINANFNVDIDNGTCLTGTVGWWYDTNGSHTVPGDRIPLLPVVFHEIAHGLGFTSLYNPSTGASSTGTAVPVWGHFLKDAATSKFWKDMTNAERQASAINDPNLIWTGPITTSELPNFLQKPAAAIINAPVSLAGTYPAQIAAFGPSPITSPVTGNVVLAAPLDGCTALTNGAAVSGKIALIDRGTCNFTVKVKNAQLAGAIGVLVANNTVGPPALPGMGGSDPTITIPSLGITQDLGNNIKALLPAPGVNVTLGQDVAGPYAGTNGGFIRMFAPNPVQPGSSVSHFTVDAYPDLLMEPNLNETLFDEVDLTVPLFRDIGWNPGTTPPDPDIFADGFESDAPKMMTAAASAARP